MNAPIQSDGRVRRFALGVLLFLGAVPLYAGDDAITVCTYNINWGNPDLAETVALIETIAPDFIALQETNPASQKFLTRKLKKRLPYTSFVAGNRGADGFGFMSKYRLHDIRYIRPKFGYFGTYRCRIKPNGKSIDIISLHLMPVLPNKGASKLDILKLVVKAEMIRKKEIESILKDEKFQSPIIVLGDFNSNSVQSAPAYLRKKNLVDSFASTNQNPETKITWQWKYRDINLRDRIDFVFHSKHLATVKCAILAKGPSDHYPVVSRLKLAQRRGVEKKGIPAGGPK